MTTTRTLAEQDQWHSRNVEAVIEAHLPIVDPHHHLWLRPPQSYQLPELLADMGSGHNVRATVFVQNGAMYRSDGPEELRPVGETDYVNAIATQSASGRFGPARACAGIVGFADLTLGTRVRAVLEAHRSVAGPRFKGIRLQAQWDATLGSLASKSPPRGLLSDRRFREGFAQLAALGLSFDAWLYFTQLDELAVLAATFPDTIIILNHIGGPLGIGRYESRRVEVFEAWSQSIAALARHDNVMVKLGGLGMPICGFGLDAWPTPPGSEPLAELWRPYVDHCIASFGVGRAMFESNFPVDRASCSYRTLWNAFKRLAAGASDDEKSQLFDRTARRIYDLGLEGCEK